jgi:type ISP restriction-modification system protein
MVLPEGRREAKFEALSKLSFRSRSWTDGPTKWRDPFLPEQEGAWASFPLLEELFVYNGSGVMPGRVWIIAPDAMSLEARWERLIREKDPEKKETLFHPHLRGGQPGDKHTNKSVVRPLAGHLADTQAIVHETGGVTKPVRYTFRTLDRQWIIPDARVINQPNPTLWDTHSAKQVYLTSPEDRTPTAGPALSICGFIPDLHHYHGRGGRVFPLWRTATASAPNIKPSLLAHLAKAYGARVAPEDAMAYIAAVLAHPAFTARFQKDLVRPGLRVPLTADGALFAKAVALGREVVWLHTYGERFADPKAGRPAGAPRQPKEQAPTIPRGGAIPGAPEPLPDQMTYDAAKRRLHIGAGFIDNVAPEVWAYEVSGMNVLRQWFSYRKRDRSRPIIGDRRKPSPLGDIQPEHWPHEYTSDLIDLLNVLGRLVALEPQQAALIEAILAGDLEDHAKLSAAGALVAAAQENGAD